MISRLLVSVGTAAGLTGAAATVSASVRYVRSFADGHLFSVVDVPWAPVGLVLGARVYPDGSPSSFLRGRLDLARILLASGKIEKILVSGDQAAKEFDETAAMHRYLSECGVADHKIILDPHGHDTYASCVRARDVYDVTRLTVITQTYHLPRAVGTARALGLDAAGVGDRSVSFRRRAWAHGVIRDQLACVKTVADLRRDHRRTG